MRLIRARATLNPVKADVLGFSGLGLPCKVTEKRPLAPSASISWTLPGALGSATNSTVVSSKPMPARAMVAATLAFFG